MDINDDQLKELARKYLEGEASEDERRLLHTWYDTVNAGELEIVISGLPQDIVSFRDGAWKEMEALIAARRALEEKDMQGAAVPGTDGVIGRRRYTLRKIAAAACFALLLGLAARWYYQRPSPAAAVGVKTERTDAAPAGNRAVLTLDDGKSIILDSAGEGALAMQGNIQIVKQEDGKIIYRKTGSSSQDAPDKREAPAVAGGRAAVSYNIMSTPRGGQYQLTLPDGTMVWLNAASSIRYPTAFTGRERRVEMHGEAYFEVAARPDQPFVVSVNKKETIEVLGTHFNVNAYEDKSSIMTTLLNGSIRVSGDGNGIKEKQPRILLPGQQAQLDKTGSLLLVDHPNIDAAMAWKNGIFSFDHSDIQSVMQELGRWYDMDVEFRGTPTSDLFGGDIRRNLPLSKVFRILEKSQVHFKIEHGKIIVMP